MTTQMSNQAAIGYTALWLVYLLLSTGLALSRRRDVALFSRSYVRLLSAPWKLMTFGVAWAGFAFMAPYTGDPTWDAVDASFMSVLTFVTSPWAVGAIVRALRKQAPLWQLFPATAVWLFSASWSYDAYVWARDGRYPATWSSNLVASSVLYVCAGLLWSLAPDAKRGVTLAFFQPSWPDIERRAVTKRMWAVVLGFILFVAAMMSPFLLELFDRVG